MLKRLRSFRPRALTAFVPRARRIFQQIALLNARRDDEITISHARKKIQFAGAGGRCPRLIVDATRGDLSIERAHRANIIVPGIFVAQESHGPRARGRKKNNLSLAVGPRGALASSFTSPCPGI